MEATSLYLVFTELLLALFGGVHFLYWASVKRLSLSGVVFFIALLTIVSALGFLLEDADGRWLNIKVATFICCLYFSSQYPRHAVLLLSILAVMGFFLDAVLTGDLFLKHVGLNANQLLLIPFTLISCALILFSRDKHINLWVLYSAISIEIFCAFYFEIRSAVISSLLTFILVSSVKASRIFLKYGKWIPFLYLVIVLLSYYSLLLNINLVPATASNIERSSMMYAAFYHFFDYPLIGPKGEFDQIAGAAANAFNWQLYSSAKGVDPHFFFFSFWRDAGAIFTLLWVIVWFYYWGRLNKLITYLDDSRIRVVLCILAIGVVQFSIAPPSTGTRLMVALIMGAALGFAKQYSLGESNQFYEGVKYSKLVKSK